jgi:hypothetical protein
MKLTKYKANKETAKCVVGFVFYSIAFLFSCYTIYRFYWDAKIHDFWGLISGITLIGLFFIVIYYFLKIPETFDIYEINAKKVG